MQEKLYTREEVTMWRNDVVESIIEIAIRQNLNPLFVSQLRGMLDAKDVSPDDEQPVAWMTANDWGSEPITTANSSVASSWKSDGRKVTTLYTAMQSAPSLPVGNEREAFERELSIYTQDIPNVFKRDDHDNYIYKTTDNAWLGWQARAAFQSAALPAPVEGWKLKQVGDDIHIIRPDGKWCGYSPEIDSPAHLLTYEFLSSLQSAALTAPAEADRKDAERYRFLRNAKWEARDDLYVRGAPRHNGWQPLHRGEELDILIDAAISAAPQEAATPAQNGAAK